MHTLEIMFLPFTPFGRPKSKKYVVNTLIFLSKNVTMCKKTKKKWFSCSKDVVY